MTDKSRLGWFLKDCTIQEYIMLGAQRALSGQIPKNLRQYSFFFNECDKVVILKAEVVKELTEAERESLDIVETEIQADFPDDVTIKTIIEVVPLGENAQPLSGGIVYSTICNEYLRKLSNFVTL